MRLDNWPTLMAQALSEARKKGFVWGDSDCCLFSCAIAKAITGENPGEWFVGKYTDKRGAAKALLEFGAGSLRETVTKIMGPEIPTSRAGRGDFVMTDVDGSSVLGVCVGETAAFIAEDGLVFIKLCDCKTAWRVG